MARRRQQEPLDWRNLESSPSSFTIPIIEDIELSPEKMVFLVYNRSDVKKKNPITVLVGGSVTDQNRGKGPGFGMPGGGTNVEHLEDDAGAAKRECGNESGLKVNSVRLIPIPGKKNKLLILDQKTGKLIRWLPYADGQQVSTKFDIKHERAILNPFNLYLPSVDWLKSKPRDFLLNFRDELITDGICAKEDVAQFGLSINDLTREELLALDLDEEEVGKVGEPEEMCEIGGFALLPISHLQWMWENRQFCLDLDEDPRHRFEKGVRTTYVYFSHVKRILQGLEVLGIIKRGIRPDIWDVA